jgi:hypothetical protein
VNLSVWQETAIRQPALLAEECVLPEFAHRTLTGSLVLTVNTGYE